MDKYDRAIEFLKNVESGSYFDECAELMEELLAQVEAKKIKHFKPSPAHVASLKQMSGGAIYFARSKGLIK